jgi:hypothetical protein
MRQAFSMVLLLRMLPRSADEEDDDYDYDGVGGGRMTIVLVENDDDDEEDDGTRHRRGQMNFLKKRTGPANLQMPVSKSLDDVRCDTRPCTSNKMETYQPVVVAGHPTIPSFRGLSLCQHDRASYKLPRPPEQRRCRSIPVRTSDDDDEAAALRFAPFPETLTHGRSSVRLLVRRPIGSQVPGCLVPLSPYGGSSAASAVR